jgi:glycosyltransferase involved in cell wall biosynthesis
MYLSGLFAHYRFVGEVASKLRLNDYDIIHVHHGQHAIFLLKLYRKPYVYTNHWQYSPGDNNLDARIERIVIRGAKTAVGLGSYLKLFEPMANHAIIPLGIDTQKWKPLERKECRDALGISEKEFIITFVGSVIPRKGVEVLLKAFKSLSGQSYSQRLYIIGNLSDNKFSGNVGNYARKLMEQAKDSPVYFTGLMDNNSIDFRRHLSAADVFVLPSRSEAQGRVVLEALSMGIPVIASEVGGLGEMINKEIGYTFRPGDHEELTKILQHLCNDSRQLKILQKNCRSYVEKRYSWKSIAMRYIDVFRKNINV